MSGRRLSSGISASLALLLAAAGAAGLGILAGGGPSRVPIVDDSPSCQPPSPVPQNAQISHSSDLNALLRKAAAGGARRALLFTDGLDTGAGPPRPPPGLVVDVSLRPRRDDCALLSLRAPERIAAGELFPVEIAVGRTAGPPDAAVRASVVLERDGRRVGAPREVSLPRGATIRLRVLDRVDTEGTVRYVARIRAGMGDPANDSAALVARVGDRPYVLAVRHAVPAGFRGRNVTGAELAALLRDAGEARAVDAVLLAGPPLSGSAQEALASAVRAGMGLLALSGTGYAGAPLESVLPLTDRPPGGRAILLVLDFSGSMDRDGRKSALIIAVRRLKDRLAPGDQLAYIAFRNGVFSSSDWTDAGSAHWDLEKLRAQGNTILSSALDRAIDVFAKTQASERRLFIVSDGEWKDLSAPDLEQERQSLMQRGVQLGAVFVTKTPPAAAAALFPDHVLAADPESLQEGLARLWRQAPDRVVKGPVPVTLRAPPPWLEDHLPRADSYARVTRLYPRGKGERIALASRELPLVGAWRPGGRVVEVAPSVDANPALADDLGSLLRSVLRPRAAGSVRLSCRRGGMGLLCRANGGSGEDFRIDGRRVPARATGPGSWEARVDRVPSGALAVRYGGSEEVVPAARAWELDGLFNDPKVAAAYAERSGGHFSAVGEPVFPDPGAPPSPALRWTFFAAIAFLLAAAASRRFR